MDVTPDYQPYELPEPTEHLPWLRLALLALVLWGAAWLLRK